MNWYLRGSWPGRGWERLLIFASKQNIHLETRLLPLPNTANSRVDMLLLE